ncbi:MAG: dipeptide epimerase, partial [Caulobacterales bacterium]
ADEAEARGFQLMVGCMNGSSLGMAPAFVLAQRCAFCDLDGPLLLAEDVPGGFVYVNGLVAAPHDPKIWG